MKKQLLLLVLLFTTLAQSQSILESSVTEGYNKSEDVWKIERRYTYDYDTNKNLISKTQYDYGSSIGSYKTTYKYNANNRATEKVVLQANDAGVFINKDKTLYTYNNFGYLTKTNEEIWENSQWKSTTSKETYDYDITGKLIAMAFYGSPKTFAYLGNNISKMTEPNNNITSYEYNSNNKRTRVLREEIYLENRDYDIVEAWNYTIDDNGNLIKQQYNEYTMYGSYEEKTIDYKYDLSYSLSNIAHPFKDKTGVDYLFRGDMPHVNKVLSNEYVYSYEGNYGASYERTTYNYSSGSLNNEKFVSTPEVKLVPNPTTSSIKLLGLKTEQNISIHNAIGTKVLEQTVQVNETINVQNLSNGLYFLKFDNGTSLKFLKQ